MKSIVGSVSVALVVAAFAALAVIPNGSLATQPTEGTGSYAVTGATVTDMRMADGTTFFSETEAIDFSGILSGSSTHDLSVEIKDDGSLSFHGKGTYTGIVDGAAGSFDYSLEGKGSVATFSLEGKFVIQKGFGDLAGLQGHATFTGVPATGGTYVLEFHFE